MPKFYRRQLRRTLTLIGLTLASVLVSAGAALAAEPDAWMWWGT